MAGRGKKKDGTTEDGCEESAVEGRKDRKKVMEKRDDRGLLLLLRRHEMWKRGTGRTPMDAGRIRSVLLLSAVVEGGRRSGSCC